MITAVVDASLNYENKKSEYLKYIIDKVQQSAAYKPEQEIILHVIFKMFYQLKNFKKLAIIKSVSWPHKTFHLAADISLHTTTLSCIRTLKMNVNVWVWMISYCYLGL